MEDEKKPKPAFLTPQDPDKWQEGAKVMPPPPVNPDKPLQPAARRFCHLVATGMRQGEAAKQVGYTQGWASLIMNSPRGRAEIQRAQDKLLEMSVGDRVKDLGTPAMDVIEDYITTDDINIKPQLKAELAKWVAEKISGKPKQEIEHSGNVVHEFMDKLDQLEQSGQILDVSPTKVANLEGTEGDEEAGKKSERDKLDQFLDFEAQDLE